MRLLLLLLLPLIAAKPEPKEPPKIRYKSGKEVNLGEQTIRGRLNRPSVSVVTGNEKEGDNGLLKLREDFLDRVARDFAEEAP